METDVLNRVVREVTCHTSALPASVPHHTMETLCDAVIPELLIKSPGCGELEQYMAENRNSPV